MPIKIDPSLEFPTLYQESCECVIVDSVNDTLQQYQDIFRRRLDTASIAIQNMYY